jgi:hypothetical protein
MTTIRLIRSELRKLTTTKMPWAFLGALVLIAAINALVVIAGTDMDGSKAFISTEADQQSLIAFAANAFMGAGFFGAIAVAREYGHHTVVPTYLVTPRRLRASLAQLAAVAIGGAVLSVVGVALTITAVALALPTTEYAFLVSAGNLAQVIVASGFAGAAGATLGAGLGALVRNVGGAVTVTVLVLMIAPPLIVQTFNEAASWIPDTLAKVLAGVGTEVSIPAAVAALAAWALVPAALGLAAITRRDVV